MVFSSVKWSNAAEIQPFIPVQSSTAFLDVQAHLKSAFEMFIRPLLGQAMTARLIEIYYMTGPSDIQKLLVETAQRANANLAWWNSFDELQISFDGSGMHRLESETQKSLYKYQDTSLRTSFREKGFSAIDDLLRIMETYPDSFQQFKDSEYYTLMQGELVRSTDEVQQFYHINSSRVIFLRLKSHLKIVSETIIRPRMATVYDALIAAMKSGTMSAAQVQLRGALVPVVVFKAVARLIGETGSISDRGLFFERLSASVDVAGREPVSDERLIFQRKNADADAEMYWKMAEAILATDFNVQPSTGTKVPRRDNTDKKSFWG